MDINKLLGNFYKEFESTQLKEMEQFGKVKYGGLNVVHPNVKYTLRLLERSTQYADRYGWWMEFGVANGGTCTYIAKRLKELHPVLKNKQVYGFDSFEGLPEDWDLGSLTPSVKNITKKGAFSTSGVIPEVLIKTPNITPVKGWFNESLPKWLKENADENSRVSFLHLDADLYSSTKTVLDCLVPYFKEKCVIHFDEFAHYVNAGEGEYKAFREFLEENKDIILNVRALGRDWRDQAVSFLLTFKNK
tara:strand:+ start:489 stop:1229 length:741 start_codon:yes stop_codon:yes gene_type:complete